MLLQVPQDRQAAASQLARQQRRAVLIQQVPCICPHSFSRIVPAAVVTAAVVAAALLHAVLRLLHLRSCSRCVLYWHTMDVLLLQLSLCHPDLVPAAPVPATSVPATLWLLCYICASAPATIKPCGPLNLTVPAESSLLHICLW